MPLEILLIIFFDKLLKEISVKLMSELSREER